MESPQQPKAGKVVIEWTLGHDPDDFDTYAWRVTCEPKIPDETVERLLSEILKVY